MTISEGHFRGRIPSPRIPLVPRSIAGVKDLDRLRRSPMSLNVNCIIDTSMFLPNKKHRKTIWVTDGWKCGRKRSMAPAERGAMPEIVLGMCLGLFDDLGGATTVLEVFDLDEETVFGVGDAAA